MEKKKVWVKENVEGFIMGKIEEIGNDGKKVIINEDMKK